MTSFLLLTLYAPLASWGDVTVGETRSSWERPSRSAILGLVAAALGLEREHQDGHDELDRSLGVAVRIDAPGRAFGDYHTAQTVAASIVKKAQPRTRRELLAAGERQTILSRRTYRQDALATAALWQRGAARWPLAVIVAALKAPMFTLYAGRKSNPFGLPLAPALVEAASLAAAFAKRPPLPFPEWGGFARLKPREGWGREVAHDPVSGFDLGLEVQRREIRRDAAAERTRWQFSERTVEVSLIPDGAA